jgi:ABC-type ATPase involved in cell division
MINFDQVSKRYPDGTVTLDRLSMVAPTRQVTVLAGAKDRPGARRRPVQHRHIHPAR